MTSVGEDADKLEASYTASENVKTFGICGKQKFSDYSMLNIELPHDSAIPLQGVHSKEVKTDVQRNTFTLLFITALFTIAKMCVCVGGNTDVPSIDKWANKSSRFIQWNIIQL